MKTSSIITTCVILLGNAIGNSVDAHDSINQHNHDVASSHQHDHDEIVDHNHFDHDHMHRGLREKGIMSMKVGNHTYASKREFIHSGHRCGSKKLSSKQLKASDEILSKWITDKEHRMDQSAIVEVETHFHVITAGSTGALSNDMLKDQIDLLNKSYKSYSFSFRLNQTTRTNKAKWYYAASYSQNEAAMFDRLRVGDASTLNVYFNAADGYLGYATFPMNYEEFPDEDGVVVASGSVPGGTIRDFNLGKTLVHEVGHWLGLSHTFDTNHFSGDGCRGDGDSVSDTPKQRSPTEGCPPRRDSCPRNAGLDMVTNYMDYSDDVCMTRFTTGQKDRMLAMWDAYRA